MTTTLDRPSLAALLQSETRAAHQQAEESTFVVALMSGDLPVSAYARLAAQHLAIYTALEEVAPLHRPAHPELLDRRLNRRARLELDLHGLLGPDWSAAAAALVVPATDDYTARIRATAAWAGGYLAHHYVRYLGDLSGGQVVRRRLRDHYGEDVPVAFYDFAEVGKAKPWKDAYRAALDALPYDEQERARVAAEAVAAFAGNRAVFAALA